MKLGTIKRLVTDRGFGFIRESNGPNEYFFHLSSCRTHYNDLAEGDEVSFDIESSPKGPRAGNVTKVE